MIRARVIHQPRSRSGFGHNHRVPGRTLAELAIKKKVARLGLMHVAADQVRIKLDQRFGVGKLRKGSVG